MPELWTRGIVRTPLISADPANRTGKKTVCSPDLAVFGRFCCVFIAWKVGTFSIAASLKSTAGQCGRRHFST
jgi:hypothetical protein